MATLQQVHPISHRPAEEFDLFCPACAYNLYGIPARRCPECGFRYDRPALLDFVESEFAAQHQARAAALVRGGYAISLALSAVCWKLHVPPIAIFIAVMLGLCVAGMIRKACAFANDRSWLEDAWWLLFRTVLLIGPAMVVTLLPTVGTFIALVLTGDTIRLVWFNSPPLPVLLESLPSPAQRTLRRYQTASLFVWIAVVGMLVAPYL
ncbi:MAG TPA: hypothetical protein VJZ71_21035 [Phycisphaerae bacterium]|nr:hypothetical protein [Phycisphaerae bacterium]